jgi:hypothetical protein
MTARLTGALQRAFTPVQQAWTNATPRQQNAVWVGATVAGAIVGFLLAQQKQKRRLRTTALPNNPAPLLPPAAAGGGQVPLQPHPDPEVFSPGFNIHPELSRVPTLMDGAEVSQDVRMLAGMYNRTYDTPEYDANAALGMILGHPPGTRERPPKRQDLNTSQVF